MKLGSEGVYLHEKCGTNPSRHLPGLKTTIKKLKMLVLGSRGFRAEILYINSRSTAQAACMLMDTGHMEHLQKQHAYVVLITQTALGLQGFWRSWPVQGTGQTAP